MGVSPGLVVMGEDSNSEGCWFETQLCILARHFTLLSHVKIGVTINLHIDHHCRGLVVSTLAEAEFFAEAGFEDILYGYPLMEHHMARNFNLAQKLNEYHVMIANDVSVDVLMRTDPPVGKKW